MIRELIKAIIDKTKFKPAKDIEPVFPPKPIVDIPPLNPSNPIPVPKPVKPKLEDK